MNKNIIIILLVMITSIVGQFRPEERNSNPKLMIKWKMTEFLDISEKQAETFFPRVNAMEKEINRLKDREKEIHKELNEMIDENSVNTKEVNRIVEELTSIEEQKIRLKMDHIRNLDDVLTPKQQAKYVAFGRSLKHRMKDKLKNKIKDRGDRRKGLDRRWD